MAASTKVKSSAKGFRFCLNNLNSENISKILSLLNDENVCIISVIGKSAAKSRGCKAALVDEALGAHVFQCELGQKHNSKFSSKREDIEIQGFCDENSKIIFLHLTSIFDASNLNEFCQNAAEDLQEKGFLEMWSDWQSHVARIVLLLFLLSHIILVVHPTPTFDVSYIYLFKTLDQIRQRNFYWLSEQLREFPISNDWVKSGRPCSPRVLFIFNSAPSELCQSAISSEAGAKPKGRKQPAIKNLEHSLEDQIYHILRKSRIITNNSGNSLFAVPANQEFVYVATTEPVITDVADFFIRHLQNHCLQSNDVEKLTTQFQNFSFEPKRSSEHSFKDFLWQHIDLALGKGFDDNVGRHPVPAYFELPSTKMWFQVATKLSNCFLTDKRDDESKGILTGLKSLLDIDVRFSEGQCCKVLPLACAAYQDNLPPHYTSDYHQKKLAHALLVFSMHARGPAYQKFAQTLQENCEQLWQAGHQMCEKLSLTGNHCVNPVHKLPTEVETEENKGLPVLPHCSQVKLISACDCGRRQATREDPFEVKVANHDFYATLHADCCGELENVDFPVFQPSTTEFRPAHVHADSPDLTDNSDNTKQPESSQAPGMSLGLSLGQSDTSDNIFQNETTNLRQNLKEGETEVVINITKGSSRSKDSPLERQPSTTEYLPGMLHSKSPSGLLPAFSSWSLLCLGPSSLYSHNIGIQDQLGFLPGTNFLLPWDVTVKLELRDKWPTLWEGKRPMGLKGKKGGKDGSQFMVKIFIGVEYECSRAHRFMCSAPDKVLRATSTGLVKDNANKVTGNDMPLFFPCPCRSGKPQMAQLMRIHIVTPKAPVHVTLNPKVQPAPSPCPVFAPGNQEPVKLSQSAYWILRLPFVYESDQGPYIAPKEPVPISASRLIKGVYDIAEHMPER